MSFPTLNWRVVIALAVVLWGIFAALPNFLPQNVREAIPNRLPSQAVSLGLDLRGGSHLLLEVDFQPVIRERLETLLADIRAVLRRENLAYITLDVINDKVVITPSANTNAEDVRNAVREVAAGEFTTSINDSNIEAQFNELALTEERRRILRQALEIVRRRIDETGTREPTVRLQGEERILVQIPGLRDPERVKELLGRTARLTFHLTDQSGGGEESAAPGFIRTPHREGSTVDVSRRVFVSGERLTNAQATFQNGQPVVAFSFDNIGGRRFGEVTAENVGRPFAVVLDDVVVTAPVIQEAITGGSGIISGRFTSEEAQDLALLLRAGALPAPLTIIEERSVGPGLGADSVRAGTIASIFALIIVMVAMIALYGVFGIFADIALLVNLILLLGLLSGLQATLTLPGIAGIILTLGMAVDANVLIFERLREESDEKRSVQGVLRASYGRALATIIDANLTTFVAALMLYIFGTGPVRGFAITLSLGLVTSVFSALVLTRGMTAWWVGRTGSLPEWATMSAAPSRPRNSERNSKRTSEVAS
ncbi:MAG: protein translocase subunit SecD [Alphaproteobacteria bacterium]